MGNPGLARRVWHSATDKKWTEWRGLLNEKTMMTGEKIIIFTEHRDTLEYLAERIRDLLGRSDAAVTIHGGVRREEGREVMELFSQDIDTARRKETCRPSSPGSTQSRGTPDRAQGGKFSDLPTAADRHLDTGARGR